jgi:LAO/AO transport system kinase
MADVDALVAAAREGDARAIGKLLSLVEDDDRRAPRALAALAGPTDQNPYVIGITGPPGAGKSTTTSALIAHWRASDKRVAVLAVDPSSPFTGGALLGDRVRMQTHATDDRVFIRSMASRGHLGGLAAATPQAVRVLESCGFDVVLVETVGVGQAEVDFAAMADTTVVLLAPGMGDGVQAAKAGLLEVADILAVNKADRDGADDTVRELRHMLTTVTDREPGQWRPPVVRTVATAEGGIAELVEAIDKHRVWLSSSDEGGRRKLARAAYEITVLANGLLAQRFGLLAGDPRLMALAEQVVAGETDSHSAAQCLVTQSLESTV